MKRKTAKELLTESFRELAAEKSIDRITVKDIVENCGYSTATFYRHFRDKYDLIAWDYAGAIEKILTKLGSGNGAWRQVLQDAADYFADHKAYLQNLFLHTSGYDSFIRYMNELHYKALRKRILEVSGMKKLDIKTDMLIRGYCLGTVNLSCEWIMEQYTVSTSDLVDVYEAMLPEPMKKYLYQEQ